MDRPPLREQITEIANQFQLFECVECATAIQEFLTAQGISGKQISLFTGSTQKPFCNIYHDRLQQNIAINGRHEAIAVEINAQKLVFDNIHSHGIPRVDWINSFHCPVQDLGGNFQITECTF